MRQGTPEIAALSRALDLFAEVVADGGANNVTAIAARCGMPAASAHRVVRTLERRAYLRAVGRGRYAGGSALAALAAAVGRQPLLAPIARPAVERLARRLGTPAHLGILEQDMVTYVVKARGEALSYTREGMQLEAYGSAVGKILLAHLPPARLELYLASGPFVSLTPGTHDDPAALRTALEQVREQGFARDEREIAPDLRCLAVPVRDADGQVAAALSISMLDGAPSPGREPRLLAALNRAARDIGAALDRAGLSGPVRADSFTPLPSVHI